MSADTPHSSAMGAVWSITQLSAETGMTRETISKRIANARLVPASGDGSQAKWRVREVLPLIFLHDDAGDLDPDKLQPHVRKAHYDAERAKRLLEIDAKRLFWDFEVEDEIANLFKLVAQTLDVLPDVLERDAGLKPEELMRVEKLVDELRGNLADAIEKRPQAVRPLDADVDALFS